MPRIARSETYDPFEVAIVHCVQRCVRRAYLAGFDATTGKDFEHRREWIRRRLELLASVFAIDVLVYSIMSNHLHLVLRTRPDVIATWSDRELATRWLRVFPGRRLHEQLAEPTSNDVDTLVNNRSASLCDVCRFESDSRREDRLARAFATYFGFRSHRLAQGGADRVGGDRFKGSSWVGVGDPLRAIANLNFATAIYWWFGNCQRAF